MKWISVKDRLPEFHQHVLTWTTDADDRNVVWMAHWNGKNNGFIANNGYRDKGVTHWAELEPPTEGEPPELFPGTTIDKEQRDGNARTMQKARSDGINKQKVLMPCC